MNLSMKFCSVFTKNFSLHIYLQRVNLLGSVAQLAQRHASATFFVSDCVDPVKHVAASSHSFWWAFTTSLTIVWEE
jgi:hypothetical protein